MILLARHGETAWNDPPPRMQGSVDPPLNERGREQARGMAEWLLGVGLVTIVTSQLGRARETAEIVAERLGLASPAVDPRLAEAAMGHWEGRLKDDVEREEPELWAAWMRAGPGFRFPGGESLVEHTERTMAALADVAAGLSPALVVCHGGTIRCAAAARHPRGLDAYHDLQTPNATVFELPSVAEGDAEGGAVVRAGPAVRG